MTKGTGKKKIDIKKIANDSARKVTFSKRRTGLFKKAQELERISGARVAILVFSPSGRLYTSGDVSLFDNNGFLKKTHLSTEIDSNSYAESSTLHLKNFNVEGSTAIFSPAGGLYSSGEASLVDDDLKDNGFTSKSHLSTETASNSYSEPSTLRLKNFNVEGCNEIMSPDGGFYSSGEFPIVNGNLMNNGFTSISHLSTESALNSYSEPSTLHMKNFNFEGSTEIFSLAGGLYSSGEVSIVHDNLKNNVFTSKSHLSTETASNSYSEPSTLRLKNFNVEDSTAIFSPAGGFYISGEFPIVDEDLKNYGFCSKSDLSTEIASNSYSEPSTLRLTIPNVEGSNEIFSPAGRFYSSGKFPIVDDDLKNNGFCSRSDLCTDFGSNLYGNCSTLWLGNLNVEECSSVDELMLLKEKLEEERDKLVLKMELEFIESLMV